MNNLDCLKPKQQYGLNKEPLSMKCAVEDNANMMNSEENTKHRNFS